MRSVTGSNMRNIMMLVGKDRVEEVRREDLDRITYHDLEDTKKWKIPCIMEIVDAKVGQLDIDGFTNEELEEILNHLCTD